MARVNEVTITKTTGSEARGEIFAKVPELPHEIIYRWGFVPSWKTLCGVNGEIIPQDLVEKLTADLAIASTERSLRRASQRTPGGSTQHSRRVARSSAEEITPDMPLELPGWLAQPRRGQ